MGRSPSCSSCCKHEESLNRGAWTGSEDRILSEYIKTHGVGGWKDLPKKAGLKRCGKSCRLRWLNYLRPDIKRGNISPEEEELLVRLHRLLGNRWSLIAGRLPSRTDNEIKNYWNTHLSKRVQMGEFEPRFQRPVKRRGIPSPSDCDEEGVVDKDKYISRTLPLKTRALRYCGTAVGDGGSYDYDHVPDTHDGIDEEEDLKAEDDHVVEIDTSKSWSQLLLEDCMADYQYDQVQANNGLQPNSMLSTSNGTDDHHQSPSLSQSIILKENHSSSYCNLMDQEFPSSKDFNSSYFDSFLDLGELSTSLSFFDRLY